jgi:hypothetical protein
LFIDIVSSFDFFEFPQILQDEKSPLYLFVDSTRETMEKNIELLISLSSLSRWHDFNANESASVIQTIHERNTRAIGLANEKLSNEASPTRALPGRHRASTGETMPQTPASHVGPIDGSIIDGKQCLAQLNDISVYSRSTKRNDHSCWFIDC